MPRIIEVLDAAHGRCQRMCCRLALPKTPWSGLNRSQAGEIVGAKTEGGVSQELHGTESVLDGGGWLEPLQVKGPDIQAGTASCRRNQTSSAEPADGVRPFWHLDFSGLCTQYPEPAVTW